MLYFIRYSVHIFRFIILKQLQKCSFCLFDPASLAPAPYCSIVVLFVGELNDLLVLCLLCLCAAVTVIANEDVYLLDVTDCSGRCPTHLAVVGGACESSSHVWLAERGVNAGVRMLQVPTSQRSSVAKLPAVELQDPAKICWSEKAQRLYVVDHGRVQIFRVRMKSDI